MCTFFTKTSFIELHVTVWTFTNKIIFQNTWLEVIFNDFLYAKVYFGKDVPISYLMPMSQYYKKVLEDIYSASNIYKFSTAFDTL